MEARLARAAVMAAALLSLGASHRTANFVVSAPSPEAARQIGEQAEKCRRELAILWLGEALPNWAQPCPVTAQVGDRIGAGGATSFMFDHGEVFGWQMTIQGSLARILDSVIPHEVTHTIFASHFRRPLPRWADEGACTTVEHASERNKQQQMLVDFLRTDRGIPFHAMFAMKEYPRDVLPLYAQGHSLATFLISHGGRAKFLQFVAQGLQNEAWAQVTREHYGFASLAELQNTWLDWVRQGSPPIDAPVASAPAPQLAAASRARPGPNLIYRGQSADPPTELAGKLVPVTRPPAASAQDQLALASGARPPRTPANDSWRTPTATTPAAARGESPAADGIARRQPPEPERQVIVEWERGASLAAATPPVSPASPVPPAGALAKGRPSVYAARGGQPTAVR